MASSSDGAAVDRVTRGQDRSNGSQDSRNGSRKKLDRCCACCMTGSCVRCSCVGRGVPCISCVPSRSGNCRNRSNRVATAGVNTASPSVTDDRAHVNRSSDGAGSSSVGGQLGHSKLEEAFGAQLVQGTQDGVSNDVWVCRWRRLVRAYSGSVYDLPGGNVGKEFVGMLVDEIMFVSEKVFCSERVIVFCRVVLQRDRMVKKGCDVRLLVKRRMEAWRVGKFDGLVEEAVRCTRSLSFRSSVNSQEQVLKVFTRLMLKGELRAATRWITERGSGRVLSPNDKVGSGDRTVLDVLREKHPDPAPIDECAMDGCDDELPALMDVSVTSGHVEKIARSLHGGAGPGGTNSSHWRSFLLRFGVQSAKLREAVASLIMMMANGIVDWQWIRALMSSRLIALDKNPGVRPIGVGEVLRRLMGKVMMLCTGVDVQDECGADQLCSGLRGGIEGAIHAVSEVFESRSGDGYGVLMVDARNAFNSLNRSVGLWNARVYWPRCSRFLFNTYRGFSSLWIKGGEDPLYSMEGVTQGDPLSMCFYAAALLPLVRSLRCHEKWTQSWYADDSACVGKLDNVKEWFEKLSVKGPRFGYYPEPSKSVLVVDSKFEGKAMELFSGVGVKVVSGSRFLGGFIGNERDGAGFVTRKVEQWVSHIHQLADAAKSQPQAAFASLLKSLQCEWMFLMRVFPGQSHLFDPLREAIRRTFWPCLLGSAVNDVEADLFSLPVKYGGLGVRDPVGLSDLSYQASKMGCEKIVEFMKDGGMFCVGDHMNTFNEAGKCSRQQQGEQNECVLREVLDSFDERRARAVRRAIDGKCSGWLSVVPVASLNFDLSAQVFRDALAVRYYRPVVALPAACDGCGAPTSVAHALSCRKGGLVIRRHNEVRDALGEMMAMAFGQQIVKEPIVKEADPECGEGGLVADLAVRGLWQSQSEALLDIRVVDTDADSYCRRPVSAVLKSAEEEKKRKYNDAVEARRGSFSPFVVSVDGFVGVEAGCILKRVAEVLGWKWGKSYVQVMGWVRCYMSLAVIRATGLCLRGSRVPWRSVGRGFEDGGGLPECGTN